MPTIDQRIAALEELHRNFQIIGGSNATVQGSMRNGYAICSTCPQEGEQQQGSNVNIPPTPPPVIPTGACCVGSDCTIETESDCTDMGGTYQGDGTECDPNPCPQPTGACCTDGVCSTLSEAECVAGGGNYLGDTSACAGIDCTKGACCDHGNCSLTSKSDCTGVYLGDGTACIPNPCSQPCDCSFYNPDDGIYYTTKVTTCSGTATAFSGGVYTCTAVRTDSGCGCECNGTGTFDSGPPFFQHCDYEAINCVGTELSFFTRCTGCGFVVTSGGCGALPGGVTENCNCTVEYSNPCTP